MNLPLLAVPLMAMAQPAAAQPSVPAVVPPPVTVTLPPIATTPEPQAEDDVHDIVITARKRIAADPAEAINVQAFQAVQSVDKAVTGPVAEGYKKALPSPARDGVRNFFANLDEPIVAANFLLQMKPGKAFETVGRFVVNSTLGIAGLFDIAKRKPFYLPRRPNGLANTLGFYGVGPGPYLYLPLIGPTTLRDVIARPVELAISPTVIGGPVNSRAFTFARWGLVSIDERARDDDRIKELRDENADIYAIYRSEYLAQRQAEIDALKGRRPYAEDLPNIPRTTTDKR